MHLSRILDTKARAIHNMPYFDTDRTPGPLHLAVFVQEKRRTCRASHVHVNDTVIDANNPPPLAPGFGGITLAYNAKSKEEVDTIFARIESIGGRIAKRPQTAFWGGYSGYIQDPDGYYWEVAYWDGWKFDANDMLVIE